MVSTGAEYLTLTAIATSDTDTDVVEDAFDRARAAIHRDEIAWSRFLPNSEISKLGQSAGQWVRVQPDTFALLQLALDAYEHTGGLYHPGLGTTMKALGYNRTFRAGLDDDTGVSAGLPSVNLDRAPFQLDADSGTVRLAPGTELDLGGIAKGHIVNRAADVLRQVGYRNVVCNAGGDMVCHGSNEGVPWTVGIDNPFDASSPIGVSLVDASLATSGTYKRVWRRGTEMIHHIVDPRTGRPSYTDIVSCTVSVPLLPDAEILAKVCLLLGVESAVPWLHQQGCKNYVIFNRRGEVIQSWKS